MRHYTVVPVTTLESGDLPPRAVVITFDDGYRSVYEHAYPLLHERSLPATTYLVTAVLDGDELVWVNEMNWLLYRHPKKCRPILATAFGVPDTAMPRAFVDRARAQYDEALIRRALDEVLGSLDPDEEKPRDAERPYVTWKEVREMKEHGMSFGNHTRSHPVMPRLDQNGMRQELNVARQAITARLGACESFAYPFGDLDSTARTIAKDAGYRSIMEVGGSNVPLDLHQVARIPVATHSVPDLFAQMEIVEPIKGRLKRLLRA